MVSSERFSELMEDSKIKEELENTIREAYKDSLMENNAYDVVLFEDGGMEIDKQGLKHESENVVVATFFPLDTYNNFSFYNEDYFDEDYENMVEAIEEKLQKIVDDNKVDYDYDTDRDIIEVFQEEPKLQPIYKEVFEEYVNEKVEQLDAKQYIDDALLKIQTHEEVSQMLENFYAEEEDTEKEIEMEF
jgi:hypothetical protein